jgi:predicted alpha/beta superfamily hydrolase
MITNDDSPLADTEVHYIRSEHVGDEFKVLVGHCGSSKSVPRPVLFMGDGWINFGTAVDTIRLMTFTEVVPEILVVAVSYRTTDMARIDDLRCRDFTPTTDLESGHANPAMMAGADGFLAFLRDELKPWVRDAYGVDTDDSMLFGYSLGGLFATYVLLNEPGVFRRYGIGSASLGWDEDLMFRHEAEYARAHNDLPAKVFFSVGAYENPAGYKHFLAQLPADKRPGAEYEGMDEDDCVADTERMVAVLQGRAYPSLEITCDVLPGEYHETAPPLALSRSLRYLFDAPR